MGLHRDPTTYSSSVVEIHVRRLVWHQICFLDLRTCEATGPRPQIRRDEYDTRFPLNVDDVDLDRAEERGEVVSEDRAYFTDMTISRMRFECYEMHRLLWVERPKMDRREKKTSITALLSRIQAFKAAMEKTYLPMLNKSIPLHVLAMEMYGILSDRMYLMVLQKFVSNQKYKMPQRLRQIVLSTAVMLLEHSMTIEQQPALAPWAWYVGALHQYHTALLLLSEMYAGERDPAMENRIWRCLDYAFELPASLSGFEKTRLVFEELAGRTEMYAAIRRMRAPTAMPHAGPRIHTAGYQQRQAEEREERERSGSVQSQSGNSSSGGAPPPLHVPHPQRQPPMGPLGAMPNVDWGTLDLGPTGSSLHPTAVSGADAFHLGGFTHAGPSPGLLSATLGGGQGSSDTSSNPPPVVANHLAGSGGGGAGGSGSAAEGGSPMDGDIDWVSDYYLQHQYRR